MTAFWEIAAHSAYDMFSTYKYIIVNLFFPTSVFGVGISFKLRLFLIIAYLYCVIFLISFVALKLKQNEIKKVIFDEVLKLQLS